MPTHLNAQVYKPQQHVQTLHTQTKIALNDCILLTIANDPSKEQKLESMLSTIGGLLSNSLS